MNGATQKAMPAARPAFAASWRRGAARARATMADDDRQSLWTSGSRFSLCCCLGVLIAAVAALLDGSVPGSHFFACLHRPRRGPVAEGAAAQGLPPVRRKPTGQLRAGRDDPGGVNVLVNDVVVLLDLHEVNGVPEAGRLEQVPRIGPQDRHFTEFVPVALEVAVVHGIEARQCCE